MKRRKFLTLTASALLGLPGCVTAKYGTEKLGILAGGNLKNLEGTVKEPITDNATLESQGSEMPYQDSEQLAALYQGLPKQKISVFYPNPTNPRLTASRIFNTTLPLNVGGNDTTLAIIQNLMSQVPLKAQIRTYDLGQANRDTLSPRTPNNQLSGDDGLKLVMSLSGYECNQFTVEAVETSFVDRKFGKRDKYKFRIHYNQQSFNAQKKRNDWRFGLETAIDGGLASATAFFLPPWGYITPAVVVAENVADAAIARIESRKSPDSAMLYSNTHFGTLLPKEASLTVHVLDESAHHRGKELIFTDLYDNCNKPCGKAVAITQGAYGIVTGPNCMEFCLNQYAGRFEIDLIRRISKVAPVIVETTRTRDRVFNSGGGRNNNPGLNSYSGGNRGGNNPGENSYNGSSGGNRGGVGSN